MNRRGSGNRNPDELGPLGVPGTFFTVTESFSSPKNPSLGEEDTPGTERFGVFLGVESPHPCLRPVTLGPGDFDRNSSRVPPVLGRPLFPGLFTVLSGSDHPLGRAGPGTTGTGS